MIGALRQLGVLIDQRPAGVAGAPVTVRVRPPERFTAAPEGIDCGLAGTVMRFVPPVAALAPGQTRFFGDPRASERPLAALLHGLRQLGVASDASRLPFDIYAPKLLGGPVVAIDATASSQFITAFLLPAARYPDGIDLRHTGATVVPSLPHVQMTIAMLADRGVKVAVHDDRRWVVQPGRIEARNQRIEPDLTNAAVFLAAGVLTGGSVAVPGWPESTSQPGDLIRRVLTEMGAVVEWDADRLVARSTGGLSSTTLDLHPASELTPVVAALAAFAEGTTSITGVAHIRGHETDRLAAISAELASVGVDAQQTDDGLVITGAGAAGRGLQPTRPLRSYADHRLAHLGALVGLVVPGVLVDDIEAVDKTLPDFTSRWQAMLSQVDKDSR